MSDAGKIKAKSTSGVSETRQRSSSLNFFRKFFRPSETLTIPPKEHSLDLSALPTIISRTDAIQHLASFPQTNPNPVIEINSQGKVTFSNAATQETLQRLGVADTVSAFFPDDFDEILLSLGRIQEPVSLYREVKIQDRIFAENVNLTKELGVARIYAHDITENKQAEDKIIHLNRVYALLSNVNQTIVRVHDRQKLFDDICRIAVEDGQFSMSWIGLLDEETKKVNVVASYGCSSDYLENLNITVTDEPQGCGPTGTAIRTGRYSVSSDIEHEDRMNPWRDRALIDCFRSSGSFPLTVFGRTIGALNIYASEVGFFDAEEIKLLNELAADISFAVEVIEKEELRRRTGEELKSSRERYRIVIEQTGHVVYDYIVATGNIRWSGALEKITGYTGNEFEAVDIKKWEAMIHPDDRARALEDLDKAMKEAGRYSVEYRFQRKDGTYAFIEDNGVFLPGPDGQAARMLGTMEDITDRKHAEEEQHRLQAQLLHSQKMEAVGQLAGGIAHDFNNILTAIIGYGNLLSMQVPEENPNRFLIDQILKAADRAASLTQGLLTFSRKQVIHPQPLSVNSVIEHVQKLLHRIIGEDIELRTLLTHENMTVLADAGQIEQVLINLCTNARDAMPEGGSLTIETGRAEIDEEYIRIHGYGKRGTYVRITVTDTGQGIDEKTRGRIFEPFFTTKEPGKGTGLGLSIVYGSIKQHNGYINISSEPGQGTTFTLYLPLLESDAQPVMAAGPLPSPKGGTETILLAEDDRALRMLAKGVLEEFGYAVIEASDGEDAIAKFNLFRDRIQLLILDVIMPKRNGREVLMEAKKIRPDIKALFTSGYPANIIEKKGVLEAGINLIAKPHSPQELLHKVRDVLDG